MTENNTPSTNILLSFFAMKGNIMTGLLVYQYWCQHIGQSIIDRALGTVYFAQEHVDKPFLILTSVICTYRVNDIIISHTLLWKNLWSRSFAPLHLE